MRKLDNTDFESSNIEYIQFWLMSPFLDPDNPNNEGGDLYFNLGEGKAKMCLKDGYKSYENGLPADGSDQYMLETAWGAACQHKRRSPTRSTTQPIHARVQDVGLDGLSNDDEFTHSSYAAFVEELRFETLAYRHG